MYDPLTNTYHIFLTINSIGMYHITHLFNKQTVILTSDNYINGPSLLNVVGNKCANIAYSTDFGSNTYLEGELISF